MQNRKKLAWKREQLIYACSRTKTSVIRHLIDAVSAAKISDGLVPYPVPVSVDHLTPEERRDFVTKEAIALALFLSDEQNHPLYFALREEAKSRFPQQYSDQTEIECIGQLETTQDDI